MTANDYREQLLPKKSVNQTSNSQFFNYQSLENNKSDGLHYQQQQQMTDLKHKAMDQKEYEEEKYQPSKSVIVSINNNGVQDENDMIFAPHHKQYASDVPILSQQSSEEEMIQKTGTAISMTSGSQQPTNTNFVSALRHKASSHQAKARVDPVFLYSSVPKIGDMFMDHQTSAITLLHFGFALLTIILIVIAYLLEIETCWKYGTYLCLVSNIFGIIHSMYSGSISSKLGRLDAALQNFALIIQKFAKALNIQEAYLCSVKNILDFLDHHILLIQYEHPEIENITKLQIDHDDEHINYKHLFKIYHQFVEKLKHQTMIQHKKWLLTFFGQYKLLDNRFGITKPEYLDFIHKLPNKSRTFFQSLTGVHTRFKQLESPNIDRKLSEHERKQKEDEAKSPGIGLYEGDKTPMSLKEAMKPSIGMDMSQYKSTSVMDDELGDDTVLLYKDMTELVYKVLDDLGTNDKRIQNELAEKMIHKERQKEEQELKQQQQHQQHPHGYVQPHGYILSKRMSVSLAHDAPQLKINKKSPKIGKGKTTISITSAFGNDEDKEASYKQMKIDDSENESDDEVYKLSNAQDANRSATLPVTNMKNNATSSGGQSGSFIKSHNGSLRKLQSIDTDMYASVNFVKQRTLSMDDDWLKKVMNDLNDDESGYYDYSHSNKL